MPEMPQIIPNIERNVKLRVSLYDLNEDSKWCERGTGQVSCYEEHLKGTSLMVVAETDGSLLLMSKIQPHISYKKEQGRFIMWTEDDVVFGLSFQDNAGCDEIYGKICQVQGKDPSEEIAEENEEDSVQEQEQNEQEQWFEDMLDLEHLELTAYEKEVLDQIIELVNNLVSPSTINIPEDIKLPIEMENEMMQIISDDIEDDADWNELHDSILYLVRGVQKSVDIGN